MATFPLKPSPPKQVDCGGQKQRVRNYAGDAVASTSKPATALSSFHSSVSFGPYKILNGRAARAKKATAGRRRLGNDVATFVSNSGPGPGSSFEDPDENPLAVLIAAKEINPWKDAEFTASQGGLSKLNSGGLLAAGLAALLFVGKPVVSIPAGHEAVVDFKGGVQGINGELLQWKGIEATEKVAGSGNKKVVLIGNNEQGMPLILGDDDAPKKKPAAPVEESQATSASDSAITADATTASEAANASPAMEDGDRSNQDDADRPLIPDDFEVPLAWRLTAIALSVLNILSVLRSKN